MMHQTPVYIICSPRPLVGKTLIIRDVDADIIVDFVPNAIQ